MIGPAEIARIIPHRPPILMLDSISEIEPGKRLTAHKTVSGAELRLSGIDRALPTALLVESWAQAALVLLLWNQPNPDVLTGKLVVIGLLEHARFGAAVQTGQRIDHHVTLVRRYADTAIVRGTASVAGIDVLEIGRMVAALRPASAFVQS